jgi:hypothetical protein
VPAIVASAAVRIQATMTTLSGLMPDSKRQITVVGVGAHGLAGARLVEEPEQGNHAHRSDRDGNALGHLDHHDLLQAGHLTERSCRDQEALAIGEHPVVGPITKRTMPL